MMNENEKMVCPNCGRHCLIDEVRCPKGEAFAAEMRGEAFCGADDVRREARGEAPRHGRNPEHGMHERALRGRFPEEGMGGHGSRGRFPEEGMGGHGLRGRFPEEGMGGHGLRGRFPEEGMGERGPHGRFPEEGMGGHGPRGRFPHGPAPLEDDGSLSTLLFRCAHEMHRPDGRGGSQGRVLRMLARWDGLSQRALQAEMGVQPGSLSELISKLEAKGLLTRAQDGEDKRRVVLHLTEAGKAAAEAVPAPEARDSRFAALTQEEQDTLRGLLKKLLAGAESDGEKA